MGGHAALANNRPDSLGENFDEAAGILAIGVTAHGGFVDGNFLAASLDQFLQFLADDRDQCFGDVPPARVGAAGLNSAAQGVGSGHAGLENWSVRGRNSLQKLEFGSGSQPMPRNNRSGDSIPPPLVMRGWPEPSGG